ncbi:MAG: NADH-quinone oxidoreductase subunit 5 family protein [Gammaproteobacteria bacterium]
MDGLAVFIPLLPFIAALLIGIGHLSGLITGESGESRTSVIALWSMTMSALLSLTLLGADMFSRNTGTLTLGNWLASKQFEIPVNFITTGINVRLAALFSVLLALVMHFSINYMHKEAGFQRFFSLLCLFSSAMLLLVLSGNAVGTFIGWEIAGVCSYLLIAYAYDRCNAVQNATRVFVTNRIGDACFVIGIGLCFSWAETVNWRDLNRVAEQLSFNEATGIALCFTVAAMAKSAQLPFSPWLARAMEGPTPSSAIFYGSVMIHAGVFLIILIHPLIAKSVFVMSLLTVIGLSTAVYGFFTGLTQTDIKSSLVFAAMGQLGLMFFECGLGLWQLALWHLCAHAIVRCYQFLTSPSLMHNVKGVPIKPVMPAVSRLNWAYTLSLHRFWLEQFIDWALVKPVSRLGHDLAYFDDFIVDRVLGSPAPAVRTISSLAQIEEQKIGARLDNESDDFADGSGLAGKLTALFANLMHWFENRFVLRGIGSGGLGYGRRFGQAVNEFEILILRPRYLVLFVFITLLIAF